MGIFEIEAKINKHFILLPDNYIPMILICYIDIIILL